MSVIDSLVGGLFSAADVVGWFGTFGLFAFYFLIARKKVLLAYAFGTTASILWAVVGIMWNQPSLIFMEVVIIMMNIYGIYNWSKKKE